MSEFNREATIKELDRIAELYNRRNDLEEEVSEIYNSAEKEQENLSTTVLNELESYQESVNKNFGADMPKLSPIARNIPPFKPDIDNKKMKRAAICGLIFIAAVVINIIISNVTTTDTIGLAGFGFTFLLIILSIATAIGYCCWNSEIQKYTEWEKKYANWKNQLENIGTFNNDHFYVECDDFEKALEKNIALCAAHYDEKNTQFESDSKAITEKWTEKLSSVNAELDNVKGQLDAVTLIHSDLFYSASHIAKLLSTQRADTLKEAINLAIEEDRKDAQEAERRREAQRQEAILEEQAFQTRMHEQAMERSAREHAAQMEAQAKAQVAETERLRRAVEQQNRNATKR